MNSTRTRTLAASLLAIVVLVLIAAASLTVFEDGSYTLGPIIGCLPDGLCQD